MRKIIINNKDLQAFKKLSTKYANPPFHHVAAYGTTQKIITVDKRIVGHSKKEINDFINFIDENILGVIKL